MNDEQSKVNDEQTKVNDEQLKQQIATAVDAGWTDFAQQHPAMAHVIDQAVMYDYVAETLADDAAFAHAYQAATEAQVGANAIGSLVRQFVDVAIARIK